jgi:1,2-diacylglycerol 3-alpha-glucosyltransferase
MRVLWLSPGFPADEHDHNCLPTLQLLAKNLLAQGVEIQVITFGYPFHNKAYQWRGISVIPAYGFNGARFRWLNWFRVIRYAWAAHRAKPFDAIHSFWLGPAWLIGRFLQFRWGIPHITTLMGQDVLPENKYRHLLRESQNLVAVSDFQNDVFEQTTGKRAGSTIPWGIDRAEIPETFSTQRPIDILGCGSFIPLKNWDLWLQIIAKVAKSQPNLHVQLLGDGVEQPRIHAQIQAMGLEQIVQLPGHLPRTEVLARMQQSRVFLHTAEYESFGFVLAEAAMCGCQLVSTPVGIASKIAFLGENAAELAQKTQLALREPLKAAAFTPFEMGASGKRYLELYEGK